jgi:hypothetical protein
MTAIREQRLLLEPVDPVAPLRQQLAKLLREAVSGANAAYQHAYASAVVCLGANDIWNGLPLADRTAIHRDVGLSEPTEADISTDEHLLAALDRRNLAALRAECDAIPARVTQAIERAARVLEPKVQAVALERATLRSEPELDAWLTRQRETIAARLKNGPVLLS